jgi:N-acetylneuraminic acid mutarotase
VNVVDLPRNQINLQMVQVGALSAPRFGVAVTAAGNKIYFAGGYTGEFSISVYSTVDIYDFSTNTWSVSQLSEARTGIAAVTVDNKVLFAGGVKHFNSDDEWFNTTSRVDIYDISNNTWTTTDLPQPRYFFYDQMGAVAGNKAFFAGRKELFPTDNVFIYDIISGTWTTKPLETVRIEHTISSAGNKVFIAGGRASHGVTKNIEVYDASLNVWTIDSLSEPRKYLRAATTGNKAFFAGGFETNQPYSSNVDIYDNNNQSWSVSHLSRPAVLSGIANAGTRVLFFGGQRVDIYDISSNSWFFADIPISFGDYASFISAGGNVYAVNGNQVWRVQF